MINQFVIKTLVSSIIIAIVSIMIKKSPLIGAITASLPITSMLVLCWLYVDTKDTNQIIHMSKSISLMIAPSFIFFIALILLIKNNVKMHYSMIFASIIMIISYSIYTFVLKSFGINI
ncbi:hypothetical protein [Clostridium tetani]|uniref:hypothetical protein n=1 Tax=Clostridium tetani TaxID=1513 RepID=UPI002953556B|nr:hypothetical protein [Clostridium tetani]BDR63858.1 hypothetical protein K134307016_07920 [Clostridium tetani]